MDSSGTVKASGSTHVSSEDTSSVFTLGALVDGSARASRRI